MKAMSRALILSTVLLIAGCGGTTTDRWTEGRPKTTPACGVVNYKGRGVEGASVSFVPTERTGTAAFARTDTEGNFSLSTFGENDGAALGQFTVTITKKTVETTPNAEDPNGPPLKSVEKSQIPARYARSGTSKLSATVSDGGENTFRFELKD